MECLTNGRNEKSYNEEVRSFCMTLHFYSPRAYNYVRGKFNNNLPSVSTMRNWYASLNACPGYTIESFNILKQKAMAHREAKRSKLRCALMNDEMAIRLHAQWNATKMQFDGFVDTGRSVSGQDSLPLAKDALVYLVSGFDEDFKIPIAYFLVNGLTAVDRAALTNEIFIRLYEIGIEVMSLTLDGLPANLAMCKILGADFENETAYISDPTQSNHKIYVFLDPPHMLKLARNSFGTRNLVDIDGGLIDWKYLSLLYDVQKSLPWNLGNKLNKAHMQWEKQKMSVKIAAETMSNSVADSLQFMIGECDSFKHAESTSNYVRIINDIFDVMNSTKNSTNATGFKRAITKTTAHELFSRFREALHYLRGLKVEGEGRSILKSSVYTAFIGFYNNMINLMNMYEDYVESDQVEEIFTHRLCQDHLECFFGSIRSMGGND